MSLLQRCGNVSLGQETFDLYAFTVSRKILKSQNSKAAHIGKVMCTILVGTNLALQM